MSTPSTQPSQSRKRPRTPKTDRITKALSRLPDNAIPQSRTVKLRYAEWIALNVPATGLTSSYEFRASDLYDPNFTGTGHQPMGFDQMISLYNHFTVLGSKIKVTQAMYASGTLAVPPVVGLKLADTTGTTSGLDISNVIEQGTKNQYMQFGYSTNQSSNWKGIRLTGVYDASKFFRRPQKVLIGDKDFSGSASSSPSENAFWSIWATGLGGNDPAEVQMLVEIEYLAVFTEPKSIAQS